MNRAYVLSISLASLGLFGFGPCSKITGGGDPSVSSTPSVASTPPVASTAPTPADTASAAATDPSAAPDPSAVPPPPPVASINTGITKPTYKSQLDQLEKEPMNK